MAFRNKSGRKALEVELQEVDNLREQVGRSCDTHPIAREWFTAADQLDFVKSFLFYMCDGMIELSVT